MIQPIALFAGSFDPFHKGHQTVISQAYSLFSKIYVVVTKNWHKTARTNTETRAQVIRDYYKQQPKIIVLTNTTSLTIKVAQKYHAAYLLRGIRTTADYEFEQQLAAANYYLDPTITTLFFCSKPELVNLSSSFLQEIEKLQNS